MGQKCTIAHILNILREAFTVPGARRSSTGIAKLAAPARSKTSPLSGPQGELVRAAGKMREVAKRLVFSKQLFLKTL